MPTNQLEQIFSSISDADLKAAVLEVKELSDTGVLPDGVVRTLSRRIHEETGISSNDARKVSESQVIRIAAFKWAGA